MINRKDQFIFKCPFCNKKPKEVKINIFGIYYLLHKCPIVEINFRLMSYNEYSVISKWNKFIKMIKSNHSK